MDEPKISLGAIRERPGFNAAQDFVTFVDVPYTVPDIGAAGVVSIPKNQFSAELAHTLVRNEAVELMKLHNAFQ